MDGIISPKSKVIRINTGMIRDIAIGSDQTNQTKHTLMIRQTKYTDDGSAPVSKMIRLTQEEVESVINFWQDWVKA